MVYDFKVFKHEIFYSKVLHIMSTPRYLSIKCTTRESTNNFLPFQFSEFYCK